MNKITFHSNMKYNLNQNNLPEPSLKNIPDWYIKADKYIKDPNTGEYLPNYDGGRAPSFKTCPAILDTFSTGYVLKTPCDLFFSTKNQEVFVKCPQGYEDFCGTRSEIPGFAIPEGYNSMPMHWYPNWGVELPKNYSAIYLQPINHYHLPFITSSGIIDNDKVNIPGLIPFFLKKGFHGILPAGTPYVQIIPFKREDWQSEIKFYNENEIQKRIEESSKIFRIPGGEAYKKKIWSRRKYL